MNQNKHEISYGVYFHIMAEIDQPIICFDFIKNIQLENCKMRKMTLGSSSNIESKQIGDICYFASRTSLMHVKMFMKYHPANRCAFELTMAHLPLLDP